MYVRAARQSNLLLGGLFRREENVEYTGAELPGETYRPYIEVTHMNHQYGVKSGSPNPNLKPGTVPVFTAHFPLYKTPSDSVLADLSVDYRLDELEGIVQSMYNSGTERLYVLNEQGQALFASDPDWVGKRIETGWSRLPGGESGHFTWKKDGFKGIVMYRHIKDPLFRGALSSWCLMRTCTAMPG